MAAMRNASTLVGACRAGTSKLLFAAGRRGAELMIRGRRP